jgi:hypothetical protein
MKRKIKKKQGGEGRHGKKVRKKKLGEKKKTADGGVGGKKKRKKEKGKRNTRAIEPSHGQKSAGDSGQKKKQIIFGLLSPPKAKKIQRKKKR